MYVAIGMCCVGGLLEVWTVLFSTKVLKNLRKAMHFST